MGLSGPRKRARISADPNNTAWAKDTSSFGQRILAQQGWKPGSFLGAKNAAHAAHYTAANASHIRVEIREDNLGLGARPGGNADNYGLNLLQNIYGRLNGKSEGELQEQEDLRISLNTHTFVEKRFGTMRFVRGGFLVGDKIEEQPSTSLFQEISKQDRHDADGPDVQRSDVTEVPFSKDVGRKASNSSKQKKKPKTKIVHEDDAPADERNEAKKALKEAKRRAKLERRERKAQKRLRREAKMEQSTSASSTINEERSESALQSAKQSWASGRMGVRQRYIRQKQMAGTDPQALREILMLKT